MSEAKSFSQSARAWITFTSERFPLHVNGLMIVAFTLGNVGLAKAVTWEDLTWMSLIPLLLCFSFFFRLRCFDEIKDYETDLVINPHRPLARNLLSIPQVKRVIYCLTVLEILLAWIAGNWLAHGIAVAYSFLMYKEFFIGEKIRPHLTLYAVTHTFVSIILGYSIMSTVIDPATGLSSSALLWAGVINWPLFNLFEFARKTYSLSEEREGVDTYSSLYGVHGALLLCFSQVALALSLLAYLNRINGLQMGLAIAYLLPLGFLAVIRTEKTASLFRNTSGVFLILIYLSFAL